MGQLRILADGKSKQAKAQARGKLFEKLMADVLRLYGYKIDKIPSVNYAGMEIDIEGRSIATDVPLYAECKCYDTAIASPKLQEFFGKYMTRWFKDKHSQGIFIALPNINSHAKAFYQENIEINPEIKVCIFEEEQVLGAIFETICKDSIDKISEYITKDVGSPGDWLLLYTDREIFWAQYIILPDEGIPTEVAFFDVEGNPLLNKTTSDYLMQLCPELESLKLHVIEGDINLQTTNVLQDSEEIVEVRGSSACFEYQFPAAPKYFVGREPILAEVDSFTESVINGSTSSRGLLFEANSGWGKSSIVLTSAARLQDKGHFAIAIDSRSASSPQFILRVVSYAFNKFGDFNGLLSKNDEVSTITGFEGALKALLNIGEVLKQNHKVLFIFLDQFENIFFMLDALTRIRNLFLKLCDLQTNVVLGFSWKSDLIGSTSEFPYQLRDTITGASKRIVLSTFSEVETTALLDRLSTELRAPLRKDLRFFLSEFSQGYPWSLKKLCSHVKTQREKGISQADLANSLLNVEGLFQEDLKGLSSEEEDALHRIAKVAPISTSELGDDFRPEVIRALVDKRLVVRIANKYDVYWDIFRDYLNTGRTPIQENYILRTQPTTVLNATRKLLAESGNMINSELRQKTGLSANSFYNVLRDMKLLGLADEEKGRITLHINTPSGKEEFEDSLREHLRDRLRRNRLVWQLTEKLKTGNVLNTDDIACLLSEWCPYISATNKTWLTYARTFIAWIDFTDLAISDNRAGKLSRYTLGAEVRVRHFLQSSRRRGGITVPRVQYTPVKKAAEELVEAILGKKQPDWRGFKKSTLSKSLATLEELGFITREGTVIKVLPKIAKIASVPDKFPNLFAESALKMKSFAAFIEILKLHKNNGRSTSQLAKELKEKLDVDWKDSTAETNVKIMLDWARHTKLAHGVFAKNQRKQRENS